MTQEQKSHRRFRRIPSENAVLVTKLDESGREEISKTRTVSLGGCMFTSDESYGVGSILELLITIGYGVVRSKARVVWEREADKKYEIGVEFIEIGSEDFKKLEGMLEAS